MSVCEFSSGTACRSPEQDDVYVSCIQFGSKFTCQSVIRLSKNLPYHVHTRVKNNTTIYLVL